MQREEPSSLSAPANALNDYMAELLRDDSDESAVASDTLEVTVAVNLSPSPERKLSPAEPKAQKSAAFSLISGEIKPDHMPMLAPNAAAEPYRLHADAVPADITLSAVQKYSLQKLLDHQMQPPGPETPVLAPQVETLEVATGVLSDVEAFERAGEDETDPQPLIESSPSEVGTAQATPEAQCSEPCDSERALEEPDYEPPHAPRDHWVNGMPDWASQRFDVLLFSCRKVTMAIPLISLGHIFLERNSLTQMPSLPPWVLGVKAGNNGHLKVIDAGAFFMPERSATLDLDDELHIVSIAGSPWAFAVDAVANPITIQTTDVQWRSQSSQSPWLAGAIKREMCVLIDPQALLYQLAR